jgi:hypothetical protein
VLAPVPVLLVMPAPQTTIAKTVFTATSMNTMITATKKITKKKKKKASAKKKKKAITTTRSLRMTP